MKFVGGFAIPFLLVMEMMGRGLGNEESFRLHSSLLRKSLHGLDLEQNGFGEEVKKLDAILSKQADLDEESAGEPPLPGSQGVLAEMETLSSALDSLSELFASIQDFDMPADVQDVLGDTTYELKKAKDASGELESKLHRMDGDGNLDDRNVSVDEAEPRRNLVHEDVKNANKRPKTRSVELDVLGDLRSHPRLSSHFDMHDAMTNGDMSFVKRKIESLGNKINWAHNARRERSLEVGIGDAAKREQCVQLIDCASAMSAYDLVSGTSWLLSFGAFYINIIDCRGPC